MILNKAQAEAVRDAICALNNVGMVADIYHFDCEADKMFCVSVEYDNRIEVSDMSGGVYERYDDFDAFVKAYELTP
mgnify:CR=1 FL=1